MAQPRVLLFSHNDDTNLQAASSVGNYTTSSNVHVSVIYNIATGEVFTASEVHTAFKSDDVRKIHHNILARNRREAVARQARPHNFKSEARANVGEALSLITVFAQKDMIVFGCNGSLNSDRDIQALIKFLPKPKQDRVLAGWKSYKQSVWAAPTRTSMPFSPAQLQPQPGLSA